MRKIFLALMATAALLGGVLATTPANAATDRRPCVSIAEYRAVHAHMSKARVHQIFDTTGYEIDRADNGYWEGEWVEDGYWDSYYDYYLDEWVDEWVDTSYWDEYAGEYVEQTDTVRSYKKCSGFDGGHGRVGINFDNYTSTEYGTGLRLYAKVRSNPWQLTYLYGGYYGASSRSLSATPQGEHKVIPQDEGRTPKPEATPLTPDPHPGN